MNLGIIIAGSIVFSVVFVYLGYKFGINTEREFAKGVIDEICKLREKKIRELEPVLISYLDKWSKTEGKLSDEEFDDLADKQEQVKMEMHEKFVLETFKQTILK